MNHLPGKERLRQFVIRACSVGDLLDVQQIRRGMLRRLFFADIWVEVTLDFDQQRIPKKLFKASVICQHINRMDCLCIVTDYYSHLFTAEELNIETDFDF